MAIEETACPQCGGPMTPRMSAHGKFWGCKAYPQCRGTRNVMGETSLPHESGTDRDGEDLMPSERWKTRDHRRW